MIKNEIVNEHAESANIDVRLFSFFLKNNDIKCQILEKWVYNFY